jgi:hypothetical protein
VIPDLQRRLEAAARTVASIAPSVRDLVKDEAVLADARSAAARGYLTPDEDERMRAWFARFLTTRAALLEMIDELAPFVKDTLATGDGDLDEMRGRAFLIAYTAACLLVQGGRHLVGVLATDKLMQRKLNEAEPRFRLPRKQYTVVYRSLTDPRHAWRLHEAMAFADAHRAEIDALGTDPLLAPVVHALGEAESSLRLGVRAYVKARLRYRLHSWRRRRASAAQQAMFSVFEAFGRVIAELRPPWRGHRVNASVVGALEEMLRPGDVVVTRHDQAMSNLFLPGYWPHAALHVGTARQRADLAIEVDEQRAARWVDPVRVLEARKDGVLFRTLPDTLAVDAVAVIRPALPADVIARAVSRAVTHEGKLYNFDFDFFRSDRLVCTEVVYRAFDGIGGISIDLTDRAGRLTLSAEDLLDLAVDDAGFEPLAVFGTPSCESELATGVAAAKALAESYRGQGGEG